jgi:hypothetical protein
VVETADPSVDNIHFVQELSIVIENNDRIQKFDRENLIAGEAQLGRQISSLMKYSGP